jgi:hypothetical protein
MVCRKTQVEIAVAAGVIILICLSLTLTMVGLLRYIYNVEDTPLVKKDDLILAGNVFQAVTLFGTLGILYTAKEIGEIHMLLGFPILVNLIIILYVTNMANPTIAGEWTAIVFLVIDALLKLVAVLVGYGVCSVNEVPQALSSMATTILGGRKR